MHNSFLTAFAALIVAKPTEKVTKEVNQIGVKELLKVDERWLDAGLQEFQRQTGDIIDFATELMGEKTKLIKYLEYCENKERK